MKTNRHLLFHAFALSFAVCLTHIQTVYAHHSPAAFNTEITDFAVEGELVSVDFRNPHSAMTVRVIDDDGEETLWEIEFSSINLLLRRDWDFDRLKAGGQIKCIGNPSALGRQEMYMWSIVLSDGTEFGR